MNIQEQIIKKIRLANGEIIKEFTSIPNPNFVKRKEIEQAIKENEGYCCCAIEKNEDTFCMCKDFREKTEPSFCHCERFYKILKCPTVCLCGSTKFKDKFLEVAQEFTLKGYIVLMPGVFAHSDELIISDEQKEFLDEVHKTKISNADLVYIINCDKYIGDSTRNEIEWAESLGKEIKYLE